MVDDILSPDDINNTASAENNLKNSVDETTDSVKGQVAVLDKLKSALLGTTVGGDNLSEVFDKISSSVSGVDLSPVTGMIKNLGSQVTEVMGNVANYSGLLVSLGDNLTRDFFNPVKEGNLAAITSFLPDAIKEKIGAVRDSMQSMLDVQNTSRVAFTRLGQSIEVTNQAAMEYPNTLRRMSAAYSVSGEKLDNMMKSLQGMPIVMKQNEEANNDVLETQKRMVSQLGQLIVVSKTFGMSEEEATQRAKSGYLEFNQSVSETVASLATMSAASKQTGIDRKIADEQIMNASKSLTMFGQKSDAAAGMWATFTNSLKDTIPIKQVGDLVTEVTNKIAGMSVQNRAFISMMSGATQGRSAMGGALQLEMAMRSPEGLEKNLQAMTSTLSQFASGKILTLEEAASNPQLEIQFQLQRDMLSKISGISDPQQQNRVLEVLQKVQSGGMSQVEGGKELTEMMAEGENIQERQLNVLDKILNQLRANAGDILKPDKQITQLSDALAGQRVGGRIGRAEGLGAMQGAQRTAPIRNMMIEQQGYTDAVSGFVKVVGDKLGEVETIDFDRIMKTFESPGRALFENKQVAPLEPSKTKRTTDVTGQEEQAPIKKTTIVEPELKQEQVPGNMEEKEVATERSFEKFLQEFGEMPKKLQNELIASVEQSKQSSPSPERIEGMLQKIKGMQVEVPRNIIEKEKVIIHEDSKNSLAENVVRPVEQAKFQDPILQLQRMLEKTESSKNNDNNLPTFKAQIESPKIVENTKENTKIRTSPVTETDSKLEVTIYFNATEESSKIAKMVRGEIRGALEELNNTARGYESKIA